MRAHYPHFSTQAFQFLRGRHQGPKSCAVDALHVGQVHNDLRHVLLDQVLNRRFQLFSSATHANAPRKVQHYDIGLHLFLLDFEHRANSSGNWQWLQVAFNLPDCVDQKCNFKLERIAWSTLRFRKPASTTPSIRGSRPWDGGGEGRPARPGARTPAAPFTGGAPKFGTHNLLGAS